MSHASLAFICLTPLLGSLLSYLVGRMLKPAAGVIATLAAIASFYATITASRVLLAAPGVPLEYSLGTWMAVGDFGLDFLFRFDQLTMVMCLVVTGVGSLIHLYSIGYMAEDEGRHRFFAYLNLFLSAMLVLVLGASLPIVFIGWEGVGLCSYLLIGFWFTNTDFAAAGKKAFVVNRIGDVGFLLAMFILFYQVGSLDFQDLEAAGLIDPKLLTLAVGALFLGATGKSAQIPLFVWLPDAMAGPTPVSALIHAATMVTAGVYLLARTYFFVELVPGIQLIIAVVAILTAFIAATTALVQNDIKKVLAYSTVSQLGFMFVAISVGAYWVAIFHVLTHAFFKACLFLGAGSVIHGCHHEQDMRRMGGLASKMPVTFFTYLISTLAIAGIAPLAGYYSKHAITAALAGSSAAWVAQWGAIAGVLLQLTAFLTAFYMTRSLVMTFMGSYRGQAHPHESPITMLIPLIVLAALACVGGVYGGEILSTQLGQVLPINYHYHSEELLSAVAHSWLGILGVVLGFVFFGPLLSFPQRSIKELG